MKRRVKFVISLIVRSFDVARAMLARSFGRPVSPVCVVLYYHAVPKALRDRFARQMEELARLALPVPCDGFESLSLGRHYAAVTFDDGFISVFENAVPELEARNIPATVFVPTGCLGQRPSWVKNPASPAYGEQVAPPELLARFGNHPLVTIGSHSISHPNFLKIDDQRAREEFTVSKEVLEKILGRSVPVFSYPHGAHDARLVDMAVACGYRHVFTIQPSLAERSDSQTAVGRVLVDPSDWPIEFRLKLLGAYRWLAWI